MTKAKPAASAANRLQKSGDHVTVGLKSPNGIVLRLQTKDTVRFATRDGGTKEIEEWHPDYESPTFVLNGNRVPHGDAPRCLVVGGFAMTPGIPKEFWEKWLDQNKNLDMVKNGLIMAHGTTASARDEATDRKDVKSGLEPLLMAKDKPDGRLPQRRDRAGKLQTAIETGEENLNAPEEVAA